MLGKRSRNGTTSVGTIFGRESKFVGTLVAEGAVRIDGSFEGEVCVEGDLVVGETGHVKATIKCKNLLAVGIVHGNVTTYGQLEIAPTGRIEGDVNTARLVIEPGGLLHGHCKMPMSEDI